MVRFCFWKLQSILFFSQLNQQEISCDMKSSLFAVVKDICKHAPRFRVVSVCKCHSIAKKFLYWLIIFFPILECYLISCENSSFLYIGVSETALAANTRSGCAVTYTFLRCSLAHFANRCYGWTSSNTVV